MKLRGRARGFREVRQERVRREPYDIVLIVCEGAKTEPHYFRELIRELRLSTANIHICGEECGSSPKSIVEYAISKFAQDDGYDRIFCVFDKDSHPDFQSAKDRCYAISESGANSGVRFEPITSVPCFEFWLLLHLTDSARPYAKTGRRSVGELAERDLRNALGRYQKGAKDVYGKVRDGLDDAIARAQRLRSQSIDNPYTDVDQLVTYLRGLRT